MRMKRKIRILSERITDMEEKRKERYEELSAKMAQSEGLTAAEREEYRLLHMEYLAEMLPPDDDDEDE